MSLPPLLLAELFPEVTARLLELLRSLSPDDWHRATVSSRRNVKDVASHLLDGSLRRLSLQRDGYRSPSDGAGPREGESLTSFLNRLNDEWETATRRLSPMVLIELIERADASLAELFAALDPYGPAIFPVAWAGEEASQNWMDVARDYTEKWHHTQQIFEATGRPSTIMTARLGRPAFDAFMRALPFTYRDVNAAVGSCVSVQITGEAGGEWRIEKGADGWRQTIEAARAPDALVVIDQHDAWKLLTKRRTLDAARAQFPGVQIHGDVALGERVLTMVSVMA